MTAHNPFSKCRRDRCEIYDECKVTRALLWTGADRVGFIKPRAYGNLGALAEVAASLGQFIRATGREAVKNNPAWKYLLRLGQPVRLAVEVAVLVMYRPPSEGGLRGREVREKLLPELGMSRLTFQELACKGLASITEDLAAENGDRQEPAASYPLVTRLKKNEEKVPGLEDI